MYYTLQPSVLGIATSLGSSVCQFGAFSTPMPYGKHHVGSETKCVGPVLITATIDKTTSTFKGAEYRSGGFTWHGHIPSGTPCGCEGNKPRHPNKSFKKRFSGTTTRPVAGDGLSLHLPVQKFGVCRWNVTDKVVTDQRRGFIHRSTRHLQT